MKRTGSPIIKIAAATSMVVFSLGAAFAGSVAWFNTVTAVDTTNSNFKVEKLSTAVTGITVHSYFGPTADGNTWGFNPTPANTVVWDGDTGTSEGTLNMGQYSLEDPNHPVLLLFQVTGAAYQAISLVTDCPYLAMPPEDYSVTVATYSALSTYSDGTKIKVTSDENHYGVSSVYQYVIPSTGEGPYFELKWLDLQQNHNPLSSVIQTHYLTFAYDPKTTNQVTGSLLVEDGQGGRQADTRTYMPVSTSSLIPENMSSFVSLDNGSPEYSNKAILFNGDTNGSQYIGIVINYNHDSLEYIYSYFLGHTYLNNGLGLGFDCDWKVIV